MGRKWLQYLVVAALILLLVPFVAHAYPPLVGADASYVVESGSMEPTIQTGAVIWVKSVPTEKVNEGDIITFVTSSSGHTTTHRFVEEYRGENDQHFFYTKGDANEERDSEVVSPQEIVGEFMFSIPYLGYVIAFVSSDIGIMLFLIVPAALLILGELWDLYREATTDNGRVE